MFKRHIKSELESYLEFMPVVLLTGARQSGKTTLMEILRQEDGFSYYTFDDEETMSRAFRDPAGWIASLPKPVIIDEVQRVPQIFLPIKRAVDIDRKAGQFILTGSANPLLLPKLGDSLAGRMGLVSLYPFSQGELYQKKETFIEKLFSDELHSETLPSFSHEALHTMLLKGGFPLVQELDERQRKQWVSSYLRTVMERDVRDITQVEGLREFPRLFRLLATRSASLFNISDVSRSMGMPNTTINRYLRLLETLYFIYLLPAWYTNLGKRVIKSSKLHLCDTGILSQLLEINEERLLADPYLKGQVLETFVFTELQKLKSWSEPTVELFHYRNGTNEVDFILERPDGRIVGVEVKSAKTIRSDDFKGLRHLKSVAKDKFVRGVVLYLGNQLHPMEKDLWTVPLQGLWQ